MDERTIRDKILFARSTRRNVVWITTALALAFTAVELKEISLADAIVPSASDSIWRFALVAYFWCWRFGCVFDTDIQELAYASLPGKGEWSLRSYGIVGLLIVVAFLLFWTQGNIVFFSLAITALFIIDFVGWRHIVRELDPEAKRSASEFENRSDYFALERLNVVRAQIQGDWKWWRLIAGSGIILMINLFAFSSTFRELVTQPVLSLRPGIPPQDAETFSYSLLVLAFVVIMEVWHYAVRLRTKISLRLMDALSESYKLARLS
jgi:hypothetical protein